MSGLFKESKTYAKPKYELNTQVEYEGKQAVITTIWRASNETDYIYFYSIFVYDARVYIEQIPEGEIVLWTKVTTGG